MSRGSVITPIEAERFRRMAWRADRWAISSESHRALDVFAHLASGGTHSFDDVVRAVDEDETDDLDPGYLARLGRIVAVRPGDDRMADFALKALRLGVPRMEKISAAQPVRELLFQLLFWRDEIGAARSLLAEDEPLQQLYHGYMAADLENPRVSSTSPGHEAWLLRFNEPFVAAGLAPLAPEPDAEFAFDTLNATPRPEPVPRGELLEGLDDPGGSAQQRLLADDPLVTVILTTFNPDPVELRTSVTSILRQTWEHLELLIVDDKSPEMPAGLLEEMEAQDERVRIIRMPVNGGTYLGRNAALREARGAYITGQDTDDWSHPQRLERELLAFHGRRDAAGVMVMANRTDDRLVRTAVGFAPQRRCEVSLMLRTEDAIGMGGYVPVRKGADSEFRERLMRYKGSQVIELADPLYMTRLSAGSLSRADFRHGWTAPARLSFSSAYRYWHQHDSRLLPPLGSAEHTDVPPFAAPARISGRPRDEGVRLDVCFLADWRGFGPLERGVLDEIEALIEEDLTVGVLQLDSPFSEVASARIMLPRLQTWINDGRVAQLMPDEEIRSRLVIVRDPSVLDYGRTQRLGLHTDRLLVVAAGEFGDDDGVLPSYRHDRVEESARRLLDSSPQWVRPQGTDQGRFADSFPGADGAVEYPLVVRTPHRRRLPHRGRSNSPVVIGRSARNVESQWPSSPESLAALYPPEMGPAVRVLGDARGGIRALGLRRMPSNWIDFRSVELDARRFWQGVDLAVHFDEEASGFGPERGILEALSAGVPVVCGERHRPYVGDAALTVPADEAPRAVEELLNDPDHRDALSARGPEFVAVHYGPTRFREYVVGVLDDVNDVEER